MLEPREASSSFLALIHRRRPTGNLTGVSVFLVALGPKHVEFLHELVPSTTIALLGNPENANFESELPDIRAAAEALKQRLEVLTASTESELEAAFAIMVQHRVGALILMPDPFLVSRREQVVELAAHHMMPTVYPSKPASGDLCRKHSQGCETG
jgi:putative tryptophan/tyrosine transport system substrate-binding protein